MKRDGDDNSSPDEGRRDDRAGQEKEGAYDPPEQATLVAGEANAVVGSVAGDFPAEQSAAPAHEPASSSPRGAFFVAAGILLSRIVGLIRQRVFAHYFGVSIAADAYAAAFRIPNFLQNVFGEGALSASFIPVYVRLLADDERLEAGRVAGAVFSILSLITSVLVLGGVFAAPLLTDLLAPGFEGEKRDLTVALVRIFFPGAGLLVMSAWCLGVLNSHRRFFLSYTAPVIWNVAIITALVLSGTPALGSGPEDLAVWGHVARFTAWGAVIGSALQFGVQLPTVLKLLKKLRLSLDTANAHVRTVIRNFLPVLLSRGVVQVSAFVDEIIASFLGNGPLVALTYTQSLYTLPVSLFGMSVSAAELPELSSAVGDEEKVSLQQRRRLDAGLRQISYFVIPSIVAFVLLGDVMVAALYQTGRFTSDDVDYVWAILIGSSLGLLPTTLGRLYASTFYARRDTRTPFRFAVLHVVLAIVLGYFAALHLPPFLGIDLRWGAVGLTASAGVAGWVEFVLLRRKLNRQIGRTGLSWGFVAAAWGAAGLCGLVGVGLKYLTDDLHPIFVAGLVLGPYGLLYFGLTSALKLPEADSVVGRFTRILRLKR